MLLVILLALLLLLVQIMLPGRYLAAQIGVEAQMGPRDHLPKASLELGRSRRALTNLQETLPIFFILAVLALIYSEQGWFSLLGGWIYLAGRVGHLICYMKGLSPWRSMSFAVALLGMVLMLVPIVPHLWR